MIHSFIRPLLELIIN